jgi:RNA polymerase sigma-70 factor (ECF subfamily)
MAASERSKWLQEGLATLAEKERAAVVLRDIEGLSTKQVAEILGNTETTVRSQISGARVKLKKFLERRGA